MSSKRVLPEEELERETPVVSTPNKRQRLWVDKSESLSRSVRSSRSSIGSVSSLFNPYNPSTPYSPSAFPVPADSPTNPFGRARHRRKSGTSIKADVNWDGVEDLDQVKNPESETEPEDDGGENMTETLELPPETPFARHLALRFQLVRRLSNNHGQSIDNDGHVMMPYRIVQVPLNYTFRHVHKLIEYLFGGVQEELAGESCSPPESTRASYKASSSKPVTKTKAKVAAVIMAPLRRSTRLQKAAKVEEKRQSPIPSQSFIPYSDQHLFEILYDMKMSGAFPKPTPMFESVSLASVAYAARNGSRTKIELSHAEAAAVIQEQHQVNDYESTWTQGLGTIETGKTRIRLSTVLDPFRIRDDDDHEHDDDVFEDEASKIYGRDFRRNFDDEEDSGTVRWTWDFEEELTLGHAWPRGGDLSRGVVYHHSPDVQVHISINTTSLPPRKGFGNRPFVFIARGYGDKDLTWRSTTAPAVNDSDRVMIEQAEGGPLMKKDVWNTRNGFQRYLRSSVDTSPMKSLSPSSSDVSFNWSSLQGDDPDISSSTLPDIPSSPQELRYPVDTPLPEQRFQRMRHEEAARRMHLVKVKELNLGSEYGKNESDSDDDAKVIPGPPNHTAASARKSSRAARARRRSSAFGEPEPEPLPDLPVVDIQFGDEGDDHLDVDAEGELDSDVYGNVDGGYHPYLGHDALFSSSPESSPPKMSSSPGLTDGNNSSSSSPFASSSSPVKFALGSPLKYVLGSPRKSSGSPAIAQYDNGDANEHRRGYDIESPELYGDNVRGRKPPRLFAAGRGVHLGGGKGKGNSRGGGRSGITFGVSKPVFQPVRNYNVPKRAWDPFLDEQDDL